MISVASGQRLSDCQHIAVTLAKKKGGPERPWLHPGCQKR
jgi:hypothetical protein